MKIRIKGNSVRIRLSKSGVAAITGLGYLEEHTSFGNAKLTYALQRSEEATMMTADFSDNKITIFIPSVLLQDWATNDVVGFDADMPVGNAESLYLLVEKDFKCLDNTDEDQSDNFENPNQTC